MWSNGGAQAAAQCDVILTTGGASRGEADFIVETIQKLGSLHAWQLAVKPGRPLAMGQVGDCVFFGLPGNPVAAFVTFLLYAQPMFARLQGAKMAAAATLSAACRVSRSRKRRPTGANSGVAGSRIRPQVQSCASSSVTGRG
jgi:molybdopterin molybdotransferase